MTAPSGVRSVARSLEILVVMGAGGRVEWTLEDVSAAVELPRTTTHRLLQTLLAAGFVERGSAFGVYRLGLRAAVVGSASLRERVLRKPIHRILRKLCAGTGETVGFAVRAGDHAVTLHREFGRVMEVHLDPRGLCPAHASAAGKVLLAALPDEGVAGLFERSAGLGKYRSNTISTFPGLLRELKQVREDGFAIDDEEYREGLRCVGVPVRGKDGSVGQCVGVSMFARKASVEDLRTYVPLLEEAAAEIAACLEGATPWDTRTTQ